MSAILSEGKTKIIRRGERPGEVVLETKDELTGGDAAKRETIHGIAVWKTTQARNVFRLLQSEGIDTAYLRPQGVRAMVCSECRMLPLELVTRRFAWGSILNREPWIVRGAWPSVDSRRAPILARGSMMRRIGRRESDASPTRHEVNG